MKIKQNKAITLIALIITIIILLILAGVTILQLTENGLFAKANQAKMNQIKSQYYEEINFDIYNEQIERAEIEKDRAFITGLNEKILKREWVNLTIKCDEYFEEQENDYNNTIIFIETKDGYEMIVDINNQIPKAVIREEYFQKVKEKSKIQYDANGGTGIVDTQEVRTGFYAILPNNSFEREYYSFVGWSKDKEGNGEIYAEGSKIKVEDTTTLYAIWKREIATITFNANSGTGIMESINVALNVSTKLPENIFEKENCYFVNWNTKADGTGTSYSTSITITEDITLYAQWKEYYTVTFNSNGGTGTMASINVKQGATTKLTANAFEKKDCYFVKWNTEADGTGTSYDALSTITVNQNIILYVIWIEDNPLKNAKAAQPANSTITVTDASQGIVMVDSKSNEWVWVEVPKIITTKATTDSAIEAALKDYTKNYKAADHSDVYYSGCGLTSSEYSTLKSKMLQSIKNNGGFWISRYEIGDSTSTANNATRTYYSGYTGVPVSKINQIPYNFLISSEAQSLASGMSTNTAQTSSLLFGIQWDLVCKFLEERTDLEIYDIKTNSVEWGNFRYSSVTLNRGKYNIDTFSATSVWTTYTTNTTNYVTGKQTLSGEGIGLTTGASDLTKKMNIYDFAGNMSEMTLEKCSGLSSHPTVYRGHDYDSNANPNSDPPNVNARYIDSIDTRRDDKGFRVTLY